ncbi:MAG: hypothetical protein OXB98_14150 [Bryobacterales bacterium]|nr:hypothetical protein [Bryobacterales bacterium]
MHPLGFARSKLHSVISRVHETRVEVRFNSPDQRQSVSALRPIIHG